MSPYREAESPIDLPEYVTTIKYRHSSASEISPPTPDGGGRWKLAFVNVVPFHTSTNDFQIVYTWKRVKER